MLPHRPHVFDAAFEAELSHSGPVAAAAQKPAQAVHHSQICPNCTHQLSGHHCKLVCTECGYYLSFADYY
jgi:ribosomal protein S27AE